MSKTYPIPLHCIIYFLLGFLLSYMCFKKVQKYHPLYHHLLIVCSIFVLAFGFYFFQLNYNEHNLNLLIRLCLSAGIGICLVCAYSLHIYYENEPRY
ncbi:unnamed protein product [Rotaria sp. Silwood1]|nr:unnamed protein product [Rotaria sp. Silwood1]CAF3403887.1 unnamed protein product [Rotaria sp. Silwood1]CAF4583824.1 unnamed protein product [Rotaria sp. Silwood1]CAF4665115.1 unnamed protein product [Rotaria sp. Silwood1]